MENWATDYQDIERVLTTRSDIREKMKVFVQSAIAGKALEGDERMAAFRQIMIELIEGRSDQRTAVQAVAKRLPPNTSKHRDNNRVFVDHWEERLVRTQFSRLYNQAVLTMLIEKGENRCFVEHSRNEAPDSTCSQQHVGKEHDSKELLENLVRAYVNGIFKVGEFKVPEHPHCSHVVRPVATQF